MAIEYKLALNNDACFLAFKFRIKNAKLVSTSMSIS